MNLEEIKAYREAVGNVTDDEIDWLISQLEEKDREIARLQEAIKILNALRRNDQKLTEKAEADNRRLQERVKELEEALWQHREDLHAFSTRPCPTCRKSASVLGIIDLVPNSCADRFADKKARQALQHKEESDDL